ncbi:MAG: hypothetical protein QOJ69_455 [Actinomycetota bacterium]|nr:hypothetical protein [Actinomycetota bacterium]
MQQLFPDARDGVDPFSAYAGVPDASGRPGVRLDMICSIDGATSFEGLSGMSGGPPDRRVFAALRSLAARRHRARGPR